MSTANRYDARLASLRRFGSLRGSGAAADGSVEPLQAEPAPSRNVDDGTESTYTARHGLGNLEQKRDKEPDLSKTLRRDVIRHTMRGIQMTVDADAALAVKVRAAESTDGAMNGEA